MLRLVFGHSTAATAAVLGIFMGGLGLGAILLGRRANSSENPLRYYAGLELGIALSAAASPFLIELARSLYIETGGSAELGGGVATLLRLVLSTAILGVPTFLMGATLPAAARAVEPGGEQRWRTAMLYGCNTLGAVAGVVLVNFVLLEALGTRATLLAAAAVNALLAAAAWIASQSSHRSVAAAAPVEVALPSGPVDGAVRGYVLLTAAAAGAAFLMMELVWYRMLAPLLGGSTYTFGVILAVALLGVGLGGLAYALEPPSARRNTLGRLALVTAIEALAAIVPFALGDRIALLTISLNSLSAAGFWALAGVWAFVAAIVVLPMSVVAGYQFPLLVDMAGARHDEVGVDVGDVYAVNTTGAILASLAGGFGAMPMLGAPGAWRASCFVLIAVAAGGALLAMAREPARRAVLAIGVLAALTVTFASATGPTAVWRQSPIGAFVSRSFGGSPQELTAFLRDTRRTVRWEEDGVESAVAESDTDSISLMVNGKSDGNAIADAPTMILTGVLPALFHPQPKRALVVGLGLGVTAGWLAAVPSIERVDVVELEPAVVRAARDAAGVNRDAVNNPKVHLIYGDAREYLLTTHERYDIISSEPSNPFRAGVASLFTKEFYDAAHERLAEGGVLAQWLQVYAVNEATVKTTIATVASVFDAVELWEVQLGVDMLLLARNQPVVHDLDEISKRLSTEPYGEAMRVSWGLSGIPGLYTGFVAGPEMARRIRDAVPDSERNTDDSTVIEFQFARSLSRSDDTLLARIRAAAQEAPEYAPSFAGGKSVNWGEIGELRPARSIHEEKAFHAEDFRGDEDAMARNRARIAYGSGHLDQVRAEWDTQRSPPIQPIDLVLVAEALADGGDDRALTLAEQIRARSVGDAEAVLARFYERKGDPAQAAEHLARCFASYRQTPWGYRPLLRRAIGSTLRLVKENPALARPLFEALEGPLSVRVAEDRRSMARTSIVLGHEAAGDCVAELARIEPWVYTDRDFLTLREKCYARSGSPLLERARRDLADYEAAATPIAFVPAAAP